MYLSNLLRTLSDFVGLHFSLVIWRCFRWLWTITPGTELKFGDVIFNWTWNNIKYLSTTCIQLKIKFKFSFQLKEQLFCTGTMSALAPAIFGKFSTVGKNCGCWIKLLLTLSTHNVKILNTPLLWLWWFKLTVTIELEVKSI